MLGASGLASARVAVASGKQGPLGHFHELSECNQIAGSPSNCCGRLGKPKFAAKRLPPALRGWATDLETAGHRGVLTGPKHRCSTGFDGGRRWKGCGSGDSRS